MAPQCQALWSGEGPDRVTSPKLATFRASDCLVRTSYRRRMQMKKGALVIAAAAIGATALSAPAEARGWRHGGWGGGWGGPAIGFGLAAGALAVAASGPAYGYGPGYYGYGPRYYGPRYGYYGPRYYRPAYHGGYYGGPRYAWGGPGYGWGGGPWGGRIYRTYGYW
jgi:hypothetical protein